jgi:hypothetical protein
VLGLIRAVRVGKVDYVGQIRHVQSGDDFKYRQDRGRDRWSKDASVTGYMARSKI